MRPRLTVSRSAVELIMAFEGFRPKSARLDDGRWTIGYGHTLTAREGAQVTESDAQALLLYDLIQTSHTVNEHVHAPLTQNQFDALVSFVFNIGVRAFRGSPTLRRLNEGRPLDAALTMELWRKADLDGERIVVDSLVRRRAAEKALFLKPTEGWLPAPTPILPPKLDYDAMALIPLTSPVVARAATDGDRVFAERAPSPSMPPLAESTASAEAANAAIERLEAILAEPAASPPQQPPPPAPQPSPVAAEPEPELETAPPPIASIAEPEPVQPMPSPKPVRPVFPQITLTTVKPVRRRWYAPLWVLGLGVVGVGLLALAAIWGVQSNAEPVLGVSPHTAGLTTGLIGVICLGVAAYMVLDRLGQPRERRFD
jgi:lysozyme